jgi:DNA-binding transcriptional regulator YiaG
MNLLSTEKTDDPTRDFFKTFSRVSNNSEKQFPNRVANRNSLALGLVETVTTLNPSHSSVQKWSNYFPQSTTKVLSASYMEAPVRRDKSTAKPLASECIRDVLRYLSLTKTQLKDVCGISRQTLYDWLSNRFEPDKVNAERLQRVNEVAQLVPKLSPYPIRSSLLTQAVFRDESLLDMLQKQTLDMYSLKQAVTELIHRSAAIEERSARALRSRLGFEKLDDSTEVENLERNLKEFSKA